MGENTAWGMSVSGIKCDIASVSNCLVSFEMLLLLVLLVVVVVLLFIMLLSLSLVVVVLLLLVLVVVLVVVVVPVYSKRLAKSPIVEPSLLIPPTVSFPP